MLVSSVMEKIESNSAPADANDSEQHHLQADDHRSGSHTAEKRRNEKRNRASSNNRVSNNVWIHCI